MTYEISPCFKYILKEDHFAAGYRNPCLHEDRLFIIERNSGLQAMCF